MKNSLLWIGLAAALMVSTDTHASDKINISNRPIELIIRHQSGHQSDAAIGLALKSQMKLDEAYSFKLISSKKDSKGNLHQRYQQYYRDIPVWGQQLLTHQKKNNPKIHLSGQYINHIDSDINPEQFFSTQSKLSILQIAKQKLSQTSAKLKQVKSQKADLFIYFEPKSASAKIAYSVEILATSFTGSTLRQMFIIDANDGVIYQTWNALKQIDISGPGGNQKTARYVFGSDYAALQGSQNSAGFCLLENDNVRAVNLGNSLNNNDNSVFQFSCPENTFQSINGAFSPINDAFFFGNLAFEMYQNWFEEKVLPGQLSMKVHYGVNNQSAFWDGQAVTFGDGNDDYYPLVDVNISVHEISHGFTESNSNLINQNESGAINESFSDIAGEVAEFYWKGEVDWAVAADILKNADGIRFFADPTQDNFSVAHFDNYFDGLDPHYASGIYNKAFYLLANTPNWDLRKAFEVFLLANKSYWLADTNFASGACGLIMASFDLEYEWLDVYKALSDVGVYCQGNAIDEDNDGMSDITEMTVGFDPGNPADAELDFDADGLSNLVELTAGFNPKDRDTDNDGLDDSQELNQYATSVTESDTDGDGMSDGWEVSYLLDPLLASDANSDKDGDGYSNLQEFIDQTNPIDATSFKQKAVQRDGIYDLEDGQIIANTSILSTADGNFIPLNSEMALGDYSLLSENIGDLQTAALVWDIELVQSGQISFDLKVSSEQHRDIFYLIIDSATVLSFSGEQDWQHINLPVDAGTHQIIFSYQKNGSLSSGEDTVWLDNLSFTGLLFDQDGDGMSDSWESFYGLDPTRPHDATGDPDEDGLTNLAEFIGLTSPLLADSDGDLLSDYDELHIYQTNPVKFDSDFDKINDGLEISLSLDPLNAADGLADLDLDGINNQTEAKYQTLLDDPQSLPELLTYLTVDFSEPLSDQWDLSEPDSWVIESSDPNETSSNKQLFAEPIGNNNQAKISYLDVFDSGTLSFTINIDSEINKDLLQIYLDDQLIRSLSGQSSEVVTLAINRGEHKITLVYNKNFALSSSVDRVSIDDFLFIAPDADTDNDGLSNATELSLGTYLDNPDTDGDGLSDGKEIEMGTDPKLADTDRDGVSDLADAYPTDATRWDQSGRWNESGGGVFFILLPLIFILALRRKN